MNRAERRKASKTKQDRVEELVHMGGQFMDMGDHARSQDAFRQVLSVEPKNPGALYGLGTLALMQGQTDQAEELLRRSLIGAPHNAEAHNNLGLALQRRGDMADAEKQYELALEAMPENVQAMNNLSRVRVLQDRPDEAVELVEKAIEMAPEFAASHMSRAILYLQKNDSEKAIESYRKVIELDPGAAEAHMRLSRLSYDGSDEAVAFASFKQVHEDDPDNPVLAVQYAEALYQAEHFEEAEAVIAPFAEDEGPIQWRAINIAAFIATSLGKFEEAIRLHKRSISLNSDDSISRINYARSLTAKGAYNKALEQLSKAFPETPFAQDLLALTYVCERELDSVDHTELYNVEDFLRVVELNLPEGYDSIEAFNAALLVELDQAGMEPIHPFDQARRLGSKLSDTVFRDDPTPALTALRDNFGGALQAYVSSLPEDKQSAFLTRKAYPQGSGAFWANQFSKTDRNIFPVERDGWIKAYYFAGAPEACADETKKAGWLHFGEPKLPGSSPDMVDKEIAPNPGSFVFFPAFFWHGFNALDAETPITLFGLHLNNKPE